MSLRASLEKLRADERRRDPSLPGSPEGRARVALCYPNVYRVGMANLGFQTVWGLLARHRLVHCDRVFLPEREEIEAIREGRDELITFDVGYRPREADVLAFAVSFESDYLNVLTLLRLMGIPLRREERGAESPLLLLGGIGATLNPRAMSPFFDAVFLGEFEPAANRFSEQAHRLAMGELSKESLLAGLDPMEGFFVPSRPETAHAEPQRLSDFSSRPAWSEFLTPHSEFPERVLVELERGCPFSCRFCAAGYAYGASRRHALKTLEKVVDDALEAFGPVDAEGAPRSIGLIGGALTEYKEIVPLARYIVEERKARVALSSMRLKRIDPELMRLLVASGQRQITVAPETGSERLRGVIKKNYSDAEVLESVRLAVASGMNNMKLYSLIGIPTETDEDVEALVALARRCREVMVETAGRTGRRPGKIIVSVGPLVPKPGTPFERARFFDRGILERRYRLLEKQLRKEPNTELRAEPVRAAYLETFLSRLEESDAPLLLSIHEQLWCGGGIARVVKDHQREIDARVYGESSERLPWHDVQDDNTRARLAREWAAARAGRGSVAASG